MTEEEISMAVQSTEKTVDIAEEVVNETVETVDIEVEVPVAPKKRKTRKKA